MAPGSIIQQNDEQRESPSNDRNERSRPDQQPEWQQPLHARGILDAAKQAGWHAAEWNGTPGIAYFLYDEFGLPIYLSDGRPARRWRDQKRENAKFPFAWGYPQSKKGEAKPTGCDFYHLPGIELAEEIREANGVLLIACGESDMLTCLTAGFRNATSFFGEKNIPNNLSEVLQRWGVTQVRYYPDNDKTGYSAAESLVYALDASGIDLRIFELPDHVEGHPVKDINDLFVALGCDPEQFRAALDELPSASLHRAEPCDTSMSSMAGDSSNEADRANHPTLDLPDDFYTAIERALGMPKYQSNGWSKPVACPFKKHEHDHTHPAGGYHRDKHIFRCFKCGQTWLSIHLGAALGLNWRDFINPETRRRPLKRTDARTKLSSGKGKPQPPTDDEVGEVVIAESEGNLAFFHGAWYRYSAGYWHREQAVGSVGNAIWAAMQRFKVDRFKPTKSKRSSVEDYLREKLAVSDERVNAGEDYINLKNGLYNLETHQVEAHRRDLYLTAQLPFDYDPSANCPTWMRCLQQWLTTPDGGVDTESIAVLQEAFGYSLTADTRFEAAFLLFGPAASGKSTVLNVLAELAGDAHTSIDLSLLDRNHYQLADLPGKRVVTCSEARSGSYLADSILKKLISGEEITARQPYEHTIRYMSRAKVWWAMNELPANRDRSDGIFRRLMILRFPNSFPPEGRDRHLFEKLKAELPGIFNWALEGLQRLRQNGCFTDAEQVRRAVDEYRLECDVERQFVEERCVVRSDLRVGSSELYAAYRLWCECNGHSPKSNTKVARDWQRLGYDREKNGNVHYLGLSLKP